MGYEQTYSRNPWQIIKKTAVNLYNHMTYTAVMSVLWLITMLPVGFIGLLFLTEVGNNPIGVLLQLVPIAALYGAFILGPVHCGLYYLAGEIIEDVARLGSLWEGLRQKYALAAKVYAIYSFILLFTIADFYIAFFFFSALSMKIIGIILFYMLLFLLMIGIYLPGFVVRQNNTVSKVFKKAVFVVLDNTILTLVMGAIYLLFPVLACFIKFLFPLLMFGYGGFLQFAGVRTFFGILDKYPDPVSPETNLPEEDGQEYLSDQ